MAKYNVVILVDASINVEVEADSEEQAKEKAMNEAGAPSICHACSSKLYVGDPIEAVEATLA